jgi:hypothetical protein
MIAPRFIFTLTGGRTGTAWLAHLIAANLGGAVLHEPLGIDDFGTQMPDVRTLRSFNDRGAGPLTDAFWARKLGTIGGMARYAETNHVLGKCGLIEACAAAPIAAQTAILVVRRRFAPLLASHVMRADFTNQCSNWQWHLDPAYANVIVDPAPFAPTGQLGQALWYVHEMAARQHCYRLTHGGQLAMIDVDFDTMTTPDGAAALLHRLGHTGPVHLPAAVNANPIAAPPEIQTMIAALLASGLPDPVTQAETYLAAGRRLDRVRVI